MLRFDAGTIGGRGMEDGAACGCGWKPACGGKVSIRAEISAFAEMRPGEARFLPALLSLLSPYEDSDYYGWWRLQ